MSTLKEALAAAGIDIQRVLPGKARPFITSSGARSAKNIADSLIEILGDDIIDYPDVFRASRKIDVFAAMLHEYGALEGLPGEEATEFEIPDILSGLTLNIDPAEERDPYFVTTENEYISAHAGAYYLGLCGLTPMAGYKIARPVIRKYLPRRPKGVTSVVMPVSKEKLNYFNTHLPPGWEVWKNENPIKWRALRARPPVLFMKLLKHLIPLEEERKYFYAWMYASLTTRAYVYLVLCGVPGSGKNRLKLVLRALHGVENTVDGKGSTFKEKFNSQISEGTLAWFDELRYDEAMENVMKEVQNDYISIERKGVDATRSSTIYTSMVISNNKPRDNFIAFDARKFAPLVLGNRDLKFSMTSEEIQILSDKVEIGGSGFDPVFVAQIAKWILRVGKKHYAAFHNLEYRGPMFWSLAHTSMTRWQKKAVTAILDTHNKPASIYGEEEEKSDNSSFNIVWSKIEEKETRKTGTSKGTNWPDYTSVRAFLEVFRDSFGDKVFETRAIKKDIFGDFMIKVLKDRVDIITDFNIKNPMKTQMERERKEKEYGEKNIKEKSSEESDTDLL